jgi:hypothetical protein
MKPLEFHYDLEKYGRCSIKSFDMRETNGKDEDVAALTSRAKGGAANMLEELVRLSITKVDGKPVNTGDGVPLSEYDDWSSRTRTFVLNAYKALNGISGEEVEGFRVAGILVQ